MDADVKVDLEEFDEAELRLQVGELTEELADLRRERDALLLTLVVLARQES